MKSIRAGLGRVPVPVITHERLLLLALVSACAADDGAGGPSTIPLEGIPDAAVFVVNGGDASISVVDADSHGRVGDIEIVGLEYPHHVYLDASEGRMAVAVPGIDLSGGHGGAHGGHGAAPPMGAVLLLDPTTGDLLAERTLAGTNHNAIFSPSGDEIWSAENTAHGGAVVVLDAESLRELGRVSVGASASEVTFAPDGRHGFVCNGGDDSVSIIDVETREVVAEIPVGDTPVGAWPGADGLMYVDNEGSGSLSAIDPIALEVVRTYELGFTPAVAAIAPNGELWVTDTEGGRVVAFDTAEAPDAPPVRSFPTGAGAHALAFSPDGATAYVTNQVAGTLTVHAVASGELLTAVAVGQAPNGLVVRSD